MSTLSTSDIHYNYLVGKHCLCVVYRRRTWSSYWIILGLMLDIHHIHVVYIVYIYWLYAVSFGYTLCIYTLNICDLYYIVAQRYICYLILIILRFLYPYFIYILNLFGTIFDWERAPLPKWGSDTGCGKWDYRAEQNAGSGTIWV